MIILDTASAIIRYKHAAIVATAPASVAAWADSNATSLTEGKSAVAGNTAANTYVTAVAAPAASTQRDVSDVYISNPVGNISDTFTVEFYDGTTAFILWSGTLAAGDTLHIGKTIEVIDTTGSRKVQAVPAGAANLIYATPNGGSGSATLRAMVAADITNGIITVAKTDVTNDGGMLHQAENILHNGRFSVAQRGSAIALTNNTLMYGDIDRWKIKVAGTTGSGTFQQVASTFTNDFSLYMGKANITTTVTGVLTLRQYIEGRNAVKLLNRNAVFSMNVQQNSGGALNYVMNIYPMTALDNGTLGTALTGGNLGANQSVPNTTETLISSGAIAMGANMGFGCVVEVVITCNVVTSKDFSFGQAQLQLGSTVTPMAVEDYQVELAKCQRYFFGQGGESINQCFGGGNNNSTTSSIVFVTMPVPLRVGPTITASAVGNFVINAAGVNQIVTSMTLTIPRSTQFITMVLGFTGPVTNGHGCSLQANGTTAAKIYYDADF